FPEFVADLDHALAVMTSATVRDREQELLQSRYRLAWSRVVRYRNAVTHGSPAPRRTGLVAQETADWAGVCILDAALRAVNAGRPISVEIQRAVAWRSIPGWVDRAGNTSDPRRQAVAQPSN